MILYMWVKTSISYRMMWCCEDPELTLGPAYRLFTLTETDSGTDSDSDYEPGGYIVLCKTCSHRTDSDSDPYFCTGQGCELESVPESDSGNVNEALQWIWFPGARGSSKVFFWEMSTSD